jgi:hypothetical protein
MLSTLSGLPSETSQLPQLPKPELLGVPLDLPPTTRTLAPQANMMIELESLPTDASPVQLAGLVLKLLTP